LNAADFKPGDWVVYVPGHANGDHDHPDCERGTVTFVGETSGLVFVRYGAQPNSKATCPADLITAAEYFGSPRARTSSIGATQFREYLGEGAFVGFDGFNIVVTAEDGIRATDVVYLEPRGFASLSSWYARRIVPLIRKTVEG
jgi:hypothetical protein